MKLRTMNDVRKWLGEFCSRGCDMAIDDIGDIGAYSLAIELLNLIGCDAAPDPWEAVADELTVLLDRQRLNCGNQDGKRIESAISAYRKLKEESREQGS